MSIEVPVCDVLLEAAEYLCKLGSNLRLRSESLKEKRISKHKLRNSHAVRKAADKILLICQLSKKSLENVEDGVNKILQSNKLNTRNNSTDSSSTKAHSSNSREEKVSKDVECFYFEYKNCKIRMSKQISLPQYTSAKVAVVKLDLAVHDKYPVYYNCKLYRHRERCQNTEVQDSKRVQFNDEKPKDLKEKDLVQSNKDQNGQETQNEKTANEETKLDDKVKTSSLPVSNSEKKVDEASKCNMKRNMPKLKDGKRIKKKNVLQSDSEEEKTVENIVPKENGSTNLDSISDKENKSCSIIEIPDDSDDDEQVTKKSIGSNNNEEKSELELSMECFNSNETSTAAKSKLSQDSNSNQPQNEDDCESELTADSDDISKPLLKCVDINKLLMPALAGNSEVTTKNKQPYKIKINHRINEKKSNEKDSDEEYWLIKRNEVKAFKSKEFRICLERCTECSNEFMNLHGILKITQCGKTIAEIAGNKSPNITQTADVNSVQCSQEKTNKSKTISVIDEPNDSICIESPSNGASQGEIEKVKSALLNESDSEKSPIKNNNEIVKICITNDTDSEKELSTDNHCNHNSKNSVKQVNVTGLEDLLKTGKKASKNSDHGERDLIESKNQPVSERNNQTTKHVEPNVKDSNNSELNKSVGEEENSLNDSEILQERRKGDQTQPDSGNDSVHGSEKNIKSDDKVIKQKTQKPIPKDIVNAKKMLLSDSDSENESEKLKSSTTQAVNSKTDCEENSNVNEVTYESSQDPTKSNTKCDSSDHGAEEEKSSNDENSKNNELKPNKSLTPGSKKKDVMDAKKMLLSDSDSDGNKLQATASEIKESLLEGSDADKSLSVKEKLTNECRRRVLATSSSQEEEDIIKPRLKKRIKRKRITSDNDNSNGSEARKSDREHPTKSKHRKMGRSKTKPIASGSNNSDSADTDKDIKGLTNLSSLSKPAPAAGRPQRASRRKPAQPQPVLAAGCLEAESDSSAPESEREAAENEELPPVLLSGLNGDALDSLAKDDLLDASESSHISDAEDSPKVEESGEEDDEEENVKSKRRKGNTISSDSEGGAAKKEPKMSDFEDSDDDGSVKKSKRKKKPVDSDASYESSDGAGSKKKRRRIKQVASEGSGSDSETEGKSKHGRKNIRKVMGKNQLEEATKKAAREEKERVARIIERQKMYNNLEFDESGKPDEVVLERVVLDFHPDTKEPLVQVDRGLVRRLKPHQANGIKFMWNACFESVKRIKKDRGSGCILAHCMGLGKTLQVVSLTHTLLTHSELTGVKRVLVVCPLSTVLNWVNEFNMWLKNTETDYEVDVYELSRHKQNSERAYQLQQWLSRGGVCVLGYEMFRNLSADNTKKYRKKMLATFQESLVSPGPDLVVCDEGHLLKNEKTSLSQSMNRVKTLRRIVLTGTPLQNNLKEYYCMVQFVKPNLLGKYNEYLNRFVNPITNGQYTDSTEHDIRIMKRRSHVLHKMLDGSVQRRDYSVLAPFLPPKHEYVLFITLSDVQVKLYETYLEMYAKKALTPGPGKPSGFLFQDFQALQRVWTHPLVMKYNSERYEIMQQKKREREEEEDSEGSLVDFIDDDSTPDESSSEDSTDLSDASDDSRKKTKKKSGKKGKGKDAKALTRRGTRANPAEQQAEPEVKPELPEEDPYHNPTEWWLKLVEEQDLEDMRNSHKLCLLFDILRQCEMIGDKLLVFSQSLYSLDLIEHFLGKVDECTQEGRVDEKLGGHVGSWSPGVDYFRLDGSTSCENRSVWCKHFNREDNPRARLFLISTRAGGLGINLVAANRVVIFDVSWNPSHDVQSIFRVYRFGQKKPCYVYRFLAMGTMEEKIYERQVTKQAISKRVIDEQQIDRHYAEHDLAELYRFEPRGPEPRPLPPLPRDRLFAEMLKDHDKMIYKYHEHDSLLENKEEETLTEEERRAAWEDFENEKNRPPPAPFPNVWPQHNGMAQGLLAQQQQMAYATLAAMLRKDMPNITESTIRDMLPMIYNANPALMQKMGEIYKYAQPGLMNPMMNVMNQAAAGGAMGGTSGLQYEPPWQRQQRQQQQARLNQMMQQQNAMGAKYYSGGLGSRDPVAMALQQARAREMMMEQHPRRPPAPPGDVVNLDSD